jgi:hypothetical protein
MASETMAIKAGSARSMEPQFNSGGVIMKKHLKVAIRRRHLFGLAIVGVAAAAASTMMSDPAFVKPDNARDKRRARYQANSPEVRNFYRVNSYPRP